MSQFVRSLHGLLMEAFSVPLTYTQKVTRKKPTVCNFTEPDHMDIISNIITDILKLITQKYFNTFKSYGRNSKSKLTFLSVATRFFFS
jgi:hypothetical protein